MLLQISNLRRTCGTAPLLTSPPVGKLWFYTPPLPNPISRYPKLQSKLSSLRDNNKNNYKIQEHLVLEFFVLKTHLFTRLFFSIQYQVLYIANLWTLARNTIITYVYVVHFMSKSTFLSFYDRFSVYKFIWNLILEITYNCDKM